MDFSRSNITMPMINTSAAAAAAMPSSYRPFEDAPSSRRRSSANVSPMSGGGFSGGGGLSARPMSKSPPPTPTPLPLPPPTSIAMPRSPARTPRGSSTLAGTGTGTKMSSYRLRSNSVFSLQNSDDGTTREVHAPDVYVLPTPWNPVYGFGTPLGSIDSISASRSHHSSSLLSSSETDRDRYSQAALPNLLGQEAMHLALRNSETAARLLNFAASRGCGQYIEFLLKVCRPTPLPLSFFLFLKVCMQDQEAGARRSRSADNRLTQIRDYTDSLRQVNARLASLSTSFTSITATSPLGLPAHLSRPLNLNIKNVANSVIPSLDSLFGESKAYIKERVMQDIFPAFVKHQLSMWMGVILAFGPAAGGSHAKFPGLRESFCLSAPNDTGNSLICTSDAFDDLTGYPRSEALGRNCRFLQGPLTDNEAISRMQDSMHAKDELVMNHRMNGEPFWNFLHVSPLFDGAGRTLLYMGAQVDVSAAIASTEDLLRVLNYDPNEDIKNRERERARSRSRSRSNAAQRDAILESTTTTKNDETLSTKSSRKSLFKPFKRPSIPQPPTNPPAPLATIVPERASSPASPSSHSPQAKTYSTRTVLQTLATPRWTLPTPYSRFILLQHEPSYPTSASASALQRDAEMRSGRPAKLSIVYCSKAVIDVLGLGMAADAIKHRDIFDVLAEQANCPSISRDFKTSVRRTVLIDGRTATMELVTTREPMMKRPSVSRLVGAASDGNRTEKMMSYWTPLKDLDDETQYVMLVLSAPSVQE
jgi:PAS domain S-box-containing protein